jgi:hypothetical protein
MNMILSLLLPYIIQPLLFHQLSKLIIIFKLGHLSRMPLTEANHRTQPGYHFKMSLAEANHNANLGHPSRMKLAETNHNTHSNIP